MLSYRKFIESKEEKKLYTLITDLNVFDEHKAMKLTTETSNMILNQFPKKMQVRYFGNVLHTHCMEITLEEPKDRKKWLEVTACDDEYFFVCDDEDDDYLVDGYDGLKQMFSDVYSDLKTGLLHKKIRESKEEKLYTELTLFAYADADFINVDRRLYSRIVKHIPKVAGIKIERIKHDRQQRNRPNDIYKCVIEFRVNRIDHHIEIFVMPDEYFLVSYMFRDYRVDGYDGLSQFFNDKIKEAKLSEMDTKKNIFRKTRDLAEALTESVLPTTFDRLSLSYKDLTCDIEYKNLMKDIEDWNKHISAPIWKSVPIPEKDLEKNIRDIMTDNYLKKIFKNQHFSCWKFYISLPVLSRIPWVHGSLFDIEKLGVTFYGSVDQLEPIAYYYGLNKDSIKPVNDNYAIDVISRLYTCGEKLNQD